MTKCQEKKMKMNEEIMQQSLDHTLPHILEFAWAINRRDIQKTLKEICYKLFHDSSVSKEKRIERAQAIKLMGSTFHEIGKLAAKALKKSDGKNPIRRKISKQELLSLPWLLWLKHKGRKWMKVTM